MTIGPKIRVLLAITIALRLCAASVVWTDAAESASKTDRRSGSALHGVTTAAALATAIKSTKTPVSFVADRECADGPRGVQYLLVRVSPRAAGALCHELARTPFGSRPPPLV